MADTQLSINDLNILFQTLTMQMLGLDPALDKSAYNVRIAWPKKGAPAWKIDEDVAFIRVIEVDDSINKQHEIITDNDMNQLTGYTRVLSVSWLIYGPSAFDNAQTIRYKIFMQAIHDILAAVNIYLIPNISAPQRAPELFEEQFWERVDMTMHFNELVMRSSAIPAIASIDVETTDDGSKFYSKPLQ